MTVKNQRIITQLILLALLIVCVFLIVYELNPSDSVYAATETIEKNDVDRLYYQGTTFHFNSYLYIEFQQDNKEILAIEESPYYYTNALNLKISWEEVGSNNFYAGHDMSIKGSIVLKKVNSQNDFDNINGIQDELKFSLPSKASSFSDISKTINNIAEGCYYFGWNIEFESWGTKEAYSGGYFIVIDRTAPTGSLIGVQNGGFTNSNVSFTWDEVEMDGLIQTESSIYGALLDGTYNGVYWDGTYYSKGSVMSEEKTYTIVLLDDVYNARVYTFTIDKTKPVITSEISNNGCTNKLVEVKTNDTNFQYLYYKSPTDTSWKYTASSTFKITANNGTWQFYATDKAGNKSDTYSIVYDDIAPSVVTLPSEFNSKDFVFSAKDDHGVSIEYWLDDNTKEIYKGSSVTIEGIISNIGTWHFVAIDDLGNRTGEYIAKLYLRDEFGNSELIKNEYKVPAYYTVRLSERYFQSIADTYSFSSYDDALRFAISKEWEYRVESLADGRWSYVNISNESVSQIYDDRAALNEAIEKYAKLNISERQIFNVTSSSNAYNNPTDGDGVTRNDALTLQNLVLPAHLSQYSGLSLYLISHSFVFSRPAEMIAGNTSVSTIKYISNGINLVDGQQAITINYYDKIEDLLNANNAYNQGYYLVEEKDLCGNVEQYIVYLDTEVPTLQAEVELGSGEIMIIAFDPYYVEKNNGVMLYTTFNVYGFIDMDEFAFIVISGRNSSSVRYVIGDDIPSLCFSNGYWGAYTITVYDRSRNALSFDIKIAGELPTLSYTSLTNETRCVFTLYCSDIANAITQIEFFKVTYTGEYIPMTTDDDGTVISAQTLSYTLRTGGKYVIRFKDIYDRVVETEPIFYMKGLPTGIFSGVRENGITNKDVSFSYTSDCSIILYIWKNSQWVMSNEFMSIEEKEGYNIASISASAVTSYAYKFFLYVTEDQNLFVEYKFEIDCIAPQVEVKTQEKTIEFESVTNSPFFVTWDETNLTAYYYNKNSALGELSQSKYTKDTYISTAGTYVFAVYDSVNNLTSFTITLDNSVSYSISGSYTRLEDGSYISKTYLTLTVSERTAVWTCISSNDFSPTNGQRIDIDGTYILHIEDIYQNSLDITLIIDNLPPECRFENEDGEIIERTQTNQSFRLICDEENVTITFSMNNSSYVAYDGQLIEQEGTYTFRLADRMNNIQTVSLKLVLTVSFTVGGTYSYIDDRYVSKNWLSVTVDNDYVSFDVENKDGLKFGAGEKVTLEGVYIITICDYAGNVATVIVEIDKTAPQVAIQTLDGQAVEKNSKISTAFIVICEEEGSRIFIAGKDLNYAVYDNRFREEQGVYYFMVTDSIGNETSFAIEIDRTVEYSVRGVYVQPDTDVFVSKTLLILEVKENYRSFYVTSDNGQVFEPGDKVEIEGEYTIEIEDIQGNIIEIIFIIDRTPPAITLEGVDVNNTTRNDVKIFVNGSSTNYYTLSGVAGKKTFVGEIVLSASGNYTVVATDLVGNQSTVTFNIDKEVSATATPSIVNGQILSESVTFKFDETLNSIILTKDGVELQYRTGKISEPGQYILTVEDAVGNVEQWSWTIIQSIAQSYDIEIPNNYKVSILLDGNVVSDVTVDGRIRLSRDGAYTIYFDNSYDSDLDFSINVVLDNIEPTVDIEIGGSSVTISNPNKDNLSFVLYKDGKQIDFSLGSTLTSAGKYKLVLTDEVGNTNVYEFELRYVNTFGIIVIVIICAVVLAVIIMLIRSRRNQRIK